MQKKLIMALGLAALSLAVFLGAPAQADTIVDTGQPTGTGSSMLGQGTSWTSWIYGQFTINQGYSITAIYGWIQAWKVNPGELPQVYAVLYTDTTYQGSQGDIHIPGNEVAAFPFKVPYTPDDPNDYAWVGGSFPVNQTPDLSPGTYWVGFEVREASEVGYYTMQTWPPNRLALQVGWNGVNYGAFPDQDDHGLGFRIYGDPQGGNPVPLPGSLLLLGSGLLCLATMGLGRRRRSHH